MNVSITGELARLNHLTSEIDALYHEASFRLGLSDSAMRILYTLCDHGESCPLREICRVSGLSKQTINSALRKLEQQGVVYLTADGGRAKTVCLTESGKHLANATVSRLTGIENEILAAWPQADREEYFRLLQTFLLAFQQKVAQLEKTGHGCYGD